MPRMINKYFMRDFRETYRIPVGAIVRSVAIDPIGDVALYFEIDPAVREEEPRTFWVVFIGRTIPHDSNYLGAVPIDGKMGHVYELLNRHERKL